MNVPPIGSGSGYSAQDNVVILESNLRAMAFKYNTTVKSLIEDAQAATDPTPDQARIVKMVERLNKLNS
jgi:hypothetical protein